jgi:hypothetical protein
MRVRDFVGTLFFESDSAYVYGSSKKGADIDLLIATDRKFSDQFVVIGNLDIILINRKDCINLYKLRDPLICEPLLFYKDSYNPIKIDEKFFDNERVWENYKKRKAEISKLIAMRDRESLVGGEIEWEKRNWMYLISYMHYSISLKEFNRYIGFEELKKIYGIDEIFRRFKSADDYFSLQNIILNIGEYVPRWAQLCVDIDPQVFNNYR